MEIHIDRTTIWLRCVAVAASVVVALAGCAADRNSEAAKTERVLAAAGFEKKFADTLEKRAHLAIQQRTANEQRIHADINEGANIDWSVWSVHRASG